MNRRAETVLVVLLVLLLIWLLADPADAEQEAVYPYQVRVAVTADGIATPEPAALAPAIVVPPAPTAEPAPSGPERVLLAVGWPEWAIPSAMAVIQCESNWDMNTIGAAGEVGVMQIHPIHFATAAALGYNLWTLEGNLGYGLHLWQQLGWQPWTCAGYLGIW